MAGYLVAIALHDESNEIEEGGLGLGHRLLFRRGKR
jgi:hypothetical protein